MYGQTVLAKAAEAAGIEWSNEEAHSAIYDAEKTAELFCTIINQWRERFPEQLWLAHTGAKGS
jgi:ribonuclease T